MRIKYEGECCGDCRLYLANGEVEGDGDVETHAAKVAHCLGADEQHTSIACDDDCPHGETCNEFSSRPCDACGTRLAGDRHKFVVLEEDDAAGGGGR